jgi:hypothetical protein
MSPEMSATDCMWADIFGQVEQEVFYDAGLLRPNSRRPFADPGS